VIVGVLVGVGVRVGVAVGEVGVIVGVLVGVGVRVGVRVIVGVRVGVRVRVGVAVCACRTEGRNERRNRKAAAYPAGQRCRGSCSSRGRWRSVFLARIKREGMSIPTRPAIEAPPPQFIDVSSDIRTRETARRSCR
jgi:hypothetical protein